MKHHTLSIAIAAAITTVTAPTPPPANAPAPAGGLSVAFQLTGTATRPGVAGADYVLGGTASYNAATGRGTIVIPAGTASATLTITPAADADPVEFRLRHMKDARARAFGGPVKQNV